jgi:hypothetical protein
MKLSLHLPHDRAQDLLPFTDTLFADEDVTTAGDHARADHPDVKIMNVEHTAH